MKNLSGYYLLQWSEPIQISEDDWTEESHSKECKNKYHMMNSIEQLLKQGILHIIVSDLSIG